LGLVVVGAARLYADRLRDGDLDLGDVAPVPQGLEDAVGEPKHQEILDGLLAEIVIDPVDLLLAKDPAEAAIERPRAVVVVSERFLDDDAGPAALGARQARGAEVLDDRVVEARRCREVEETGRGAGTSFRRVRSPEAPKITSVKGSSDSVGIANEPHRSDEAPPPPDRPAR